MKYKVHHIERTGEKIGRFWNWENRRQNQGNWFTLQVGDVIWNISKKYTAKDGRVLDYSAGAGYMAKHILEKERRIIVDCAEQSPEGRDNICNLLKQYKNFGGTYSLENIPVNKYDAVFFNATIEHIGDDYLVPTLSKLKSLMGGNNCYH